MNRCKEKEVRRSVFAPSDLHVREAGDGGSGREICGYAILFGCPSAPLWSEEESEAREVIDAAAVTQELLDGSDIKFTMFHDRQLILARSNHGSGTLSYTIDSKGVAFRFEAPATADGDKALELVRRGDIAGCSFAFSTRYWDADFVERSVVVKNGRSLITYRVKAITGIYDFTLASDPAYPETSVEAREFAAEMREGLEVPGRKGAGVWMDQVREMRRYIIQNS